MLKSSHFLKHIRGIFSAIICLNERNKCLKESSHFLKHIRIMFSAILHLNQTNKCLGEVKLLSKTHQQRHSQVFRTRGMMRVQNCFNISLNYQNIDRCFFQCQLGLIFINFKKGTSLLKNVLGGAEAASALLQSSWVFLYCRPKIQPLRHNIK